MKKCKSLEQYLVTLGWELLDKSYLYLNTHYHLSRMIRQFVDASASHLHPVIVPIFSSYEAKGGMQLQFQMFHLLTISSHWDLVIHYIGIYFIASDDTIQNQLNFLVKFTAQFLIKIIEFFPHSLPANLQHLFFIH